MAWMAVTKKGNRKRQPVNPKAMFALNMTMIFAGSAIVAIAYNLFLLPNRIASGGVSGFATIVYDVFGIEPAITLWAFNIPLFLAGVLLLGALNMVPKQLLEQPFCHWLCY